MYPEYEKAVNEGGRDGMELFDYVSASVICWNLILSVIVSMSAL